MTIIKNIISIILRIIYTAGLWMIFRKLGDKGWKALIPGYRLYRLGELVDRESEGRKLILLDVLVIVMSIYYVDGVRIDTVGGHPEVMDIFVLLVSIFCGVANFVYLLRIYSGLCRVFDRRKRWLFLFAVFDEIVLFIWGIRPEFAPVKKAVVSGAGADVSGMDIESIDSGLSVNIKERSVLNFGKKRILLRDIHLNIPRGHMVLLLGGSGAGKTTFVNAVTGYEQADAVVKLDGQDVYHDYQKMKYSVGFVPQQDLMRGHDTVGLTLSDAAILRLPSNIRGRKRRKKIRQVLEEFGLFAVKDSLVEKLSGGQRKRLSIAMEYISDPSLFILDEPDSGLDGVVARGIFEKLRAIADEDRIVIVITHTPDRVLDLFDDVIVLAKDSARTGRQAFFGSVKEAEEFFGKESMEGILKAINQTDEGGEGRADEYVEKYVGLMEEKVSQAGELASQSEEIDAQPEEKAVQPEEKEAQPAGKADQAEGKTVKNKKKPEQTGNKTDQDGKKPEQIEVNEEQSEDKTAKPVRKQGQPGRKNGRSGGHHKHGKKGKGGRRNG